MDNVIYNFANSVFKYNSYWTFTQGWSDKQMWPGLWKSTMWGQQSLIFYICSIITYNYLRTLTKMFTTDAQFNGMFIKYTEKEYYVQN